MLHLCSILDARCKPNFCPFSSTFQSLRLISFLSCQKLSIEQFFISLSITLHADIITNNAIFPQMQLLSNQLFDIVMSFSLLLNPIAIEQVMNSSDIF